MRPLKCIINSRKFDGSIKRSWECSLLKSNGLLLEFVGEFESDIDHPDLGIIGRGTISYEYYWLDRWYNVFRFDEPDGRLRNYYCNINMPPTYKNGVLDYIDLDIDVVVWPNFSYAVLDEDEFALNAALLNYPASVSANACKALAELKTLIAARWFPFDH